MPQAFISHQAPDTPRLQMNGNQVSGALPSRSPNPQPSIAFLKQILNVPDVPPISPEPPVFLDRRLATKPQVLWKRWEKPTAPPKLAASPLVPAQGQSLLGRQSLRHQPERLSTLNRGQGTC